jgi:hypothetical protein
LFSFGGKVATRRDVCWWPRVPKAAHVFTARAPKA